MKKVISHVSLDHIKKLKDFKGAESFESNKYLKVRLGNKEFRARK